MLLANALVASCRLVLDRGLSMVGSGAGGGLIEFPAGHSLGCLGVAPGALPLWRLLRCCCRVVCGACLEYVRERRGVRKTLVSYTAQSAGGVAGPGAV